MTLSDIRSKVLTALNESTSSPKFWTSAEIDSFINEAYIDLTSSVDVISNTETISLLADRFVYDLVPTVTSIIRMYYVTDELIVLPISFQELNKRDQWWKDTTGDYPDHYIPIGTNQIMLYPKVDTYEDKVLTYHYFSYGTKLVNDTDTPDISASYHLALYHFALGMARLRTRITKNYNMALQDFSEYEKIKKELSIRQSNLPNRKVYLRGWI